MKDNVNSIINDVLGSINIEQDNWNCYFGYDCIEITLSFEEGCDRSIFPEDIIQLGRKLNTDISWIRVEDNHLIIGYDISNIILDKFGSWENYNNYYNSSE